MTCHSRSVEGQVCIGARLEQKQGKTVRGSAGKKKKKVLI